MVKLLSIISIILVIVLFPPSVLAVLSNNALPGDAVYPIKRSLENGIYAIASINPISKAWFASARSDRRFKEFSTLIIQGKKGKETLNELVEQTSVAAEEIRKVDDPVKKQELIVKLSQSIEKYDQGLRQIAQQQTSKTPAVVNPTSIPTPSPTETLKPTAKPVNFSTPSPTPTYIPIPTPTSAPEQNQGSVDQSSDVDDAIDRLEKIKDKLKERNEKKEKNQDQEKEHKNIDNQKKEDDKLTPEKETDKIKKEKR